MGWRRGELWFEADVAWFGEGAAAPAVAGLALPPLPSFGPTGLHASRQRREAWRRRRRTRATVFMLLPAVMVPPALFRSAGAGAEVLAEDPPSLTFRIDPQTRAPARGRGRCTDAEAVARDRNRTLGRISEDRVAQRDIGWPVVERKPDRRHPAPRRGPELGDLEPGYGLGPERAEAAPRERAHDPHDHLGHRRVPRREPPRTTRRRG